MVIWHHGPKAADSSLSTLYRPPHPLPPKTDYNRLTLFRAGCGSTQFSLLLFLLLLLLSSLLLSSSHSLLSLLLLMLLSTTQLHLDVRPRSNANQLKLTCILKWLCHKGNVFSSGYVTMQCIIKWLCHNAIYSKVTMQCIQFIWSRRKKKIPVMIQSQTFK